MLCGMRDVFINALGCFLPGEPVGNREIEDHIGRVGGAPCKFKSLVLRQNRIKTRHYALDKNGAATHSNSGMAALALKDAIARSEISVKDIAYLATSTTIGDLMVPGLASHVHALSGIRPIEIASFQSVCASSLMAFKSAWLQLRAGEHDCAAVCGSEFASRYFRPGFYEGTLTYKQSGEVPLNAAFLRFTLSDGAGAAILEIQAERAATVAADQVDQPALLCRPVRDLHDRRRRAAQRPYRLLGRLPQPRRGDGGRRAGPAPKTST